MVVHQIIQTLVVEMKLLPLQYLLDEAQEYEVYLLYDSLQYANRAEWEQTRLIMYVIAQTQSRKKIDMTDIMSLPWDELFEEHNTEMTNEQRDMLKERAKAMEKILSQQK